MATTPTPRFKLGLTSALLWATLYFVSGYISHQLNGPVELTGYIWLPAGVTVGAYMLRPMRDWLALGCAFLVAQLVLAGIEHSNYLNAVLFTINEVGAAALAVWLACRTRFSLEGLYFLRSVILAGLLAGVFAALGGAAWYAILDGAPLLGVGFVWAASDFVGVLLVVPVLASWSRFRAHRSGDQGWFDLVLGVVSFLLLAAGTTLIFDGDSSDKFGMGVGFALTYIPLFLTVVITVLLGGRSGSLAVLILALIVILETAQGEGPFPLLAGHHGHSLLEAQLYLAIASLLVLTVSTLKTTRERVHERVAVLQNNMECALASAGQIAYVLDAVSGSIDWSGDVQRVFGVGVDATQLTSVSQVLERLHPDDREMLRTHWRAEMAGENRNVVTLRIMLPDGGTRVVRDRGAPLLDWNVNVAVVAGVWQLEYPPAQVAG
ncbi:MASE1 domain-containing protein [Paraburkholderia hayleyella]|uniref:MASE1 domain-containing protein n=1 Tax=Paraburkholderia hayleyella TaxID=2152889 RepID=UPI001291BEEE|nr:MASE1 domain-containing protein [Paraburkholderia hayleyella]